MRTITIILIMLLSFSTYSQKRGEKIKALKIAFITERLNLTTEEAQQFWPIYNEHEDNQEAIRKKFREIRRGLDLETISNSEAEKLVNNMLDIERSKTELHNNYFSQLLKVLPAKKVLQLASAEEAFKKRMLREMQKRREGFRKN